MCLVRGASVVVLAFLHRHSTLSEAPDLRWDVQESLCYWYVRFWCVSHSKSLTT